MELTRRGRVGRALYGILFAVVIPLLLVGWVWRTADVIRLAPLHAPWTGAALVVAGAALMLAGMHALLVHGGGLPMNPFPPPRYVSRGVYRCLGHPIYTGFAVAVAGASIAAGSGSGLWLVTPLVAAGCAALVLGYEQHDLRRRFGGELRRPLLSLPPPTEATPAAWSRASAYVLVLLPWLLVYEAAVLAGMPAGAIEAYFAFERSWPVLPWTEPIYASAYVVVCLAPLVAAKCRELRRFCVSGLLATALNGLLFFTLPLVAPPRAFVPQGFWGTLLDLERRMEGPSGAAAFPAFHVTWSFIAAAVFASRFHRFRGLFHLWGALVAGSCIGTGMHAVADVLAGFCVFLLVHRIDRIWQGLRAAAEAVANSWREWRVGRVRIIHHGAYGAGGAFTGVAMAGALMGAEHVGELLAVAAASLVAAAFWAQLVEGASVSLRPFGYYGSVIGAALAGAAVGLLGGSGWLVLAALSVAAPWVQALGRLRCLVQGCCHGREAPSGIGIRFQHPRSRVVRLSSLGGAPIHPTQLYSILWNAVCGAALLRLWCVEPPLPFVAGSYLILAGLGRFVEESYRGEPQTPRIAGLPIYQWNAVASVVLGAVLTCLRGGSGIPEPRFDLGLLAAATAFALLTGVAMGVDFPDSNRRFARLVK
ncbi:MAG: prolipoprotein diacylglyceryl transferase [Planctomycetes bacterium]|nr:prolipoprotein diacylglyceryl transferase [Planctomycetota bacterium]